VGGPTRPAGARWASKKIAAGHHHAFGVPVLLLPELVGGLKEKTGYVAPKQGPRKTREVLLVCS
jgi:hypothetical protein